MKRMDQILVTIINGKVLECDDPDICKSLKLMGFYQYKGYISGSNFVITWVRVSDNSFKSATEEDIIDMWYRTGKHKNIGINYGML